MVWKEVNVWLWLLVSCVMFSKNRRNFTDVGDVGRSVVRHVLIQIGGAIMSVRRVYSGNGLVKSCVSLRLMSNGELCGSVYVVSGH